MTSVLQYKGYFGEVEFSPEDCVLFGTIKGISDLITFESDSARTIEQEFHEAVDDYINYCKEVGKEPNKSYKGSFNVRISPELHRELDMVAIRNQESLNQTVEKAIEAYVHSGTLLFANIDSINDSLSAQASNLWNERGNVVPFSLERSVYACDYNGGNSNARII